MKKVDIYILLSILGSLSFPLGTAHAQFANPTRVLSPTHHDMTIMDEEEDDEEDEEEEYYQIMNRDQIDHSNAQALPFDDSDEDEEEIDSDEDSDTVLQPHAR